MRTERVLAAHAARPFDLSVTESLEYVGRAVAALTGDAELMRRTSEVLHWANGRVSVDLEYGMRAAWLTRRGDIVL